MTRPTAPDVHVARPLILLLTPSDRNGDAQRLTNAGLRVIVTSRAESSLRQVFSAQPTVIAIEWLPSFAADTLIYVAQLMLSARSRPIAVLVYGSAAGGSDNEVRQLGGEWVEVTDDERDALVSRVCDYVEPHGRAPQPPHSGATDM